MQLNEPGRLRRLRGHIQHREYQTDLFQSDKLHRNEGEVGSGADSARVRYRSGAVGLADVVYD